MTNSNNVSGPVEADPEYALIVEANNLAVEIDTEICTFSSVLVIKIQTFAVTSKSHLFSV